MVLELKETVEDDMLKFLRVTRRPTGLPIQSARGISSVDKSQTVESSVLRSSPRAGRGMAEASTERGWFLKTAHCTDMQAFFSGRPALHSYGEIGDTRDRFMQLPEKERWGFEGDFIRMDERPISELASHVAGAEVQASAVASERSSRPRRFPRMAGNRVRRTTSERSFEAKEVSSVTNSPAPMSCLESTTSPTLPSSVDAPVAALPSKQQEELPSSPVCGPFASTPSLEPKSDYERGYQDGFEAGFRMGQRLGGGQATAGTDQQQMTSKEASRSVFPKPTSPSQIQQGSWKEGNLGQQAGTPIAARSFSPGSSVRSNVAGAGVAPQSQALRQSTDSVAVKRQKSTPQDLSPAVSLARLRAEELRRRLGASRGDDSNSEEVALSSESREEPSEYPACCGERSRDDKPREASKKTSLSNFALAGLQDLLNQKAKESL